MEEGFTDLESRRLAYLWQLSTIVLYQSKLSGFSPISVTSRFDVVPLIAEQYLRKLLILLDSSRLYWCLYVYGWLY
ncbi:MAG: hypothetical protein QXJ56_05040 [Ignisphaera sp.]|uniref:Uncharacterized protein n=1 Tax=Ignisphaera aggregans TaxID=334771 RepID=A0A7J3I8M7_9CREN